MLGVASTHSGAGKTVVTLGLLKYYDRVTSVQPFKVGPDFIDPLFHETTVDRPSINLDRFFMGEDDLRALLNEHLQGSGIGIVEGVMGLYDGRSGEPGSYSTAEVFRLLEIPYVLVVDGSGKSHSVAAEVKGFNDFDESLDCIGVILTKVAGERHETMLREALESSTELPVLGTVSRDDEFELDSRHLGLDTSKLKDAQEIFEAVSPDKFFNGIDDDTNVLPGPTDPNGTAPESVFRPSEAKRTKIGIAYDDAFHFYYDYNLRILRNRRAKLVQVSPLEDKSLPEDLDALYIGGGYPENHGRRLSSNESFLADLRSQLRDGLVCLAECGGLIYLGESLEDRQENHWEMTGWLPIDVTMESTFQALGYVQGRPSADHSLVAGEALRGHEFHYASAEVSGDLSYGYELNSGNGLNHGKDGLIKKNTLASFTHWHWGSNEKYVDNVTEFLVEKRRGVALA